MDGVGLNIDWYGVPLLEDLALKVKPEGRIVLIQAGNAKDLSKPVLRIQENYEGRKYKSKSVSMRQFKKWYKARRKDTQFTYYEDWLGFNFPGQAVLDFLELYKDKMNEAEKEFISKLDLTKIASQYVIAVLEGDSDTLLHEMAHALFYLDSGYKAKVTEYLNKMQYIGELSSIFSKTDYHSSVWIDEMQAYLIAGIGELEVKGKPAYDDVSKFDQIVKDLKALFDSYAQNYPEVVGHL